MSSSAAVDCGNIFDAVHRDEGNVRLDRRCEKVRVQEEDSFALAFDLMDSGRSGFLELSTLRRHICSWAWHDG